MLPDLSEYKWIVPDFVWELDEYIDFGRCWIFSLLLMLHSHQVFISTHICNIHHWLHFLCLESHSSTFQKAELLLIAQEHPHNTPLKIGLLCAVDLL